MKKGAPPPFASSWDDADNEDVSFDNDCTNTFENSALNDIPVDLLKVGKGQYNRLMQMQTMNHLLRNTGWTNERSNTSNVGPAFVPDRMLTGTEWRAEVVKKRQDIQDARMANSQPKKVEPSSQQFEPGKENIVKIVDKSYLEKRFHSKDFQFQIEESVQKYTLNEEQERAFRIVANHAVSPFSEQLKMYIAGIGGTGKSQVLKALSHFFVL